jgi:hypothetical protein
MTEKEKVTKNYGRLFYRIVYLNRVPLYFRLEQNTTTKQKETFVKRDQFPHPLLSQATSMPHPIVSKVQEKENQNPIVTIPRLHTPTFLFLQRREREMERGIITCRKPISRFKICTSSCNLRRPHKSGYLGGDLGRGGVTSVSIRSRAVTRHHRPRSPPLLLLSYIRLPKAG